MEMIYSITIKRIRVRRILRNGIAVTWDSVEQGDVVTFKFAIATLSNVTILSVDPNSTT
jgi:hypothetical protein